MGKRISVLINNYNYAQYLGACIDSALAQDHPDFEVIVVDDGSTDNSRDVIASYGTRIKPVLKQNGGQASSFNAGFAAASGDIVCMLDADDTFLPGKLTTVAEIFEREALDWCFDKVTTDSDALPPSKVELRRVNRSDVLAKRGFPSLPVPTSGLSFSRKLIADNAILPMPVATDVVLSDNYLKFAAACHGDGAIVETPLTFQRIHATNRYTNADKSQKLRSRIMVQTGLELAHRYPALRDKGFREISGGLSRGRLSIAETWSEIVRCTHDGIFGWGAPFRLAAFTAAKRLRSR